MICAAAVCPPPPGLVPAVGVGLPEMEPVRVAAADAVADLVAAEPDRVVVLGPAGMTEPADESAGGSFAGFGIDVTTGGPDRVLPWPHAVGAWLLDQAGWQGARLYVSDAWVLGSRDAVLVMADSDTAVGVSAPTHGDPRAAKTDEVIAEALASGDAHALAGLDVELARDWDGTGVAPLQLLGRLVGAETSKGTSVTARLRCDEAPFGVRYWVASWSLSR